MIYELDDKRNQIRDAMIIEKDYNKSIRLLEDYMNTVDSYDNISQSEKDLQMWFAYYNMGLSYKKLGEYDDALKCAGMSLGYYGFKVNKTQSMWLMAVCFEEMGNYKNAIEMHYECLRIYKEFKDNRLRVCVLFNIAKLQNKPNKMLRLINVCKKIELSTSIVVYSDKEKNAIIADMQKELFEMYIDKDNYQDAFKLAHSAVDTQLKKEMITILRNKTLIA